MKLHYKLLKTLKKLFGKKSLDAANTWANLGFNPDEDYWLFATPVHLILQRDSFSMAEPLSLTTSEHESLITTLNTHFKADDLQFYQHEKAWFLRIKNDPQINTVAPQTVIHRDIQAYLPTGPGAAKWAQLSNEIQMLLFEHPVNIVRDNAKQLTINSIWFYGLGRIKDKPNLNSQ